MKQKIGRSYAIWAKGCVLAVRPVWDVPVIRPFMALSRHQSPRLLSLFPDAARRPMGGTGDAPGGRGRRPRAGRPFHGGNAIVFGANPSRPEGTTLFFGVEKFSTIAKNFLNDGGNFLNDVRNWFTDVGNLLNDDGNFITDVGNILSDDGNLFTDDGNFPNDDGNLFTDDGNCLNDVRNFQNDNGNSPTGVRNVRTGGIPPCRIAAPEMPLNKMLTYVRFS